MNILLAPDSFKGCLTSAEVCAAISEGILKYSKDINIMQFPSSDGGEGFCDCMHNLFGGERIKREVTYPLGDRGFAEFVFNRQKRTAYIEMASASGLALVPPDKRNVLKASTYGTGELIKAAIALGADRIVIGLGGSATNDCGMGMLAALGMKFFDFEGSELYPCGESLACVRSFDKSGMLDVSHTEIIAACDVKNPLCGEYGAAQIFSRQKGASEAEVLLLDNGARSFASVLGIDPEIQGSGAAGGLGAAVLSVLGGSYISGASLLANSQEFQAALSKSDLLITGEGNTDAQSAFGKLVAVVAEAAYEKGVKVCIISGGLSDGYEMMFELGVERIDSLSENGEDIYYCIKNARRLISEKAFQLMNAYK